MFTSIAKLVSNTALTINADSEWEVVRFPTNAHCQGPVPIAMELLKVHFSVRCLPAAYAAAPGQALELYTNTNVAWQDSGAYYEGWAGDVSGSNRRGVIIHEAILCRDHEPGSSVAYTQLTAEHNRLATYKRIHEYAAYSNASALRGSHTHREEGELWDFTDGAGNGLLIASNHLTLSGKTGVSNDLSGDPIINLASQNAVGVRCVCTIFYRMRNCSLQQFISAASD